MRQKQWFILLVLWVFLCTLGPGASGAPADYLIDVWDTDNGLQNSSVTAIAQGPDGYLWIGTYNGLVRFDGVRFVTYEPESTPALEHARIQDIAVDVTGTVWINTYKGGLTSYKNGVLKREYGGVQWDLRTSLAHSTSNEVTFVTQLGRVFRKLIPREGPGRWIDVPNPANERLSFQCAQPDGTLWFTSRTRNLVFLRGTNYIAPGPEVFPFPCVMNSVVCARNGQVLAGTDRGVLRWTGTRFEDITPTNAPGPLQVSLMIPVSETNLWVLAGGVLRKQMGREFVQEAPESWRGLLGPASGRAMGVHVDKQGGIWMNHYGNGLFHITREGAFERLTTLEGLPGDRLWAWFAGREGDVWLGIDRGGLVRLRERKFSVVGPEQGLGARAAFSVCEDEAGVTWFGTSGGGLVAWTPQGTKTFQVSENLSESFVFSIFAKRGGGLWLSTSAGEDLHTFQNGTLGRAPWEEHGVKAIFVDSAGTVWVGTKSGLVSWTPEGRRVFRESDGMPVSAVRALAQAPDGAIWCGDDDGFLFKVPAGGKLERFRPSDGQSDQQILSIFADADGTIWAGTFGGGILRLRDGKFARIGAEAGLKGGVVTQILEDDNDHLWLGTHQGLCRVSRSALNNCADGITPQLEMATYGRQDGLPTLEFAANYQPSCWKTRDGRLWFATVKGMVSVRPEQLRKNPVPPPVVIEELEIDGKPFPIRDREFSIPPGKRQYIFQFTALSFVAPEKVRFRYKLEGLDPEWVDAGTRRNAQYSHLPAGPYTFRVLACNNDGIWNEVGKSLQFEVLPRFYETWWFATLAGLATVGGVAGTVRKIATRKYKVRLAKLQQQHAIELDRARIAKDIHDDLGAGLTQVMLLSELARREPDDQSRHLQRISETARDMTRAMDEIVWAVDPQHDTLPGLIDYASAFAEDFLRVGGLRCRNDFPAELPPMKVDAETRYNVFLAFKETLNNIVKHAEATEVWLRLHIAQESFSLCIEDDGKGLDPKLLNSSAAPRVQDPKTPDPLAAATRLSSGRGLSNLKRRLESVGGKFDIRGGTPKGTRVEISARAMREGAVSDSHDVAESNGSPDTTVAATSEETVVKD